MQLSGKRAETLQTRTNGSLVAKAFIRLVYDFRQWEMMDEYKVISEGDWAAQATRGDTYFADIVVTD